MGMHELCELNSRGDTKTVWDSDNQDEIDNARATFDRLKSKGFGIFRVGKDGEAAKPMKEFDPDAEKMIAVAPIAGG